MLLPRVNNLTFSFCVDYSGIIEGNATVGRKWEVPSAAISHHPWNFFLRPQYSVNLH
jgi:hypothetical protein